MFDADADGPKDGSVADPLLAWYDRNYRRMPWRAAPDAPPVAPYRVWLSEVMLQQTTVATVEPYYRRFVERWPTVQALAAAELDHVLTEWSGLGYYARARNLHRCAGVVSTQYGGRFPAAEDELRKLPGVGGYTAAAIAAIAYQQPATVVDGNVERVMARLFAVQDPLPSSKPQLHTLAAGLSPIRRPGDYAQAMMDLGATVCRPRAPHCDLCPLAANCRGHAQGIASTLPHRLPRKPKPTRKGTAFWTLCPDGRVLLRRRAPEGLLGGMLEVPSSPWTESGVPDGSDGPGSRLDAHAPASCAWRAVDGEVRHTFTHFHLILQVVVGRVDGPECVLPTDADLTWARPDDLDRLALPTVMKKVARLALSSDGG